jgi:hypothetical protein
MRAPVKHKLAALLPCIEFVFGDSFMVFAASVALTRDHASCEDYTSLVGNDGARTIYKSIFAGAGRPNDEKKRTQCHCLF